MTQHNPSLYRRDSMGTRLRVIENGDDGAIQITLDHHETRRPTYFFMTAEQRLDLLAWLTQLPKTHARPLRLLRDIMASFRAAL